MPNSTDKASDLSSFGEIKGLLTTRSSIKGQITKFRNYLSTISEVEELTNVQLAELGLKLGKFESLSVKFEDLQNRIEVLSPDNLANEIDERESIESSIIISIATGKTLIEHHNKRELEQKRLSIASDGQCCHDHQHHDPGFKLPLLEISKFDGTYFRWLEFRDTFESLIHNNNRIKPVHKFQYLISYLEGDAARIISNLEVSSANYPEAWGMILDRYDNKRLLINHHLSALFNVNSITRESERSLRFLVDHVTKNLRALDSLGQPTDKWDMLLIFMLAAKLDSHTLTKWEEHRNTLDDLPTLEQFKQFLIARADVLEALNRNKCDSYAQKFTPSTPRSAPTATQHFNKQDRPQFTKTFASTSQYAKSVPFANQNKQSSYFCIICDKNHKVFECPAFQSMSIQERLDEVARYKLCDNCLRQGHRASDCRGGPCRQCNQMHNSLLHGSTPCVMNNAVVLNQSPNTLSSDDKDTAVAVHQSSETAPCVASDNATVINQSSVVNSINTTNAVLLSTAVVEVTDPVSKNKLKVRALLDSGSESSFISKSLQEKLSIQAKSIDCLKVIGIGNSSARKVVESCNVQINSLHNAFKVTISCLILKELTSNIPKTTINIKGLKLPANIKLADPEFSQSAPIDVLIGADLFWDLIGNEQLSLGPSSPRLRSSELGWLISGPINSERSKKSFYCNHATLSNSAESKVDEMLTKFWEIEDVPTSSIKSMSEKDNYCEKHFLSNTFRLDSGRYCVKLPLTESPERLGDSYYLAKRRLLNLERKLKKNPYLKTEYEKFINEYANLGHLSESTVAKPHPSYFLSHHAVFKSSSESTSLRVVFDGSAPSSSGLSLNDILMVGPNVQDSLFSILIRARQYKYILAADIEKMYRQVLVDESDRNLQLILWREDESRPIRTLQLNTLTYGTASASYLSTRCLSQIGEEQDDELIKNIIKKDFYVDDLITGTNDENELRHIQKSVAEALKSCCFNLRKYKSNLPTLFANSKVNLQDNLTISESSSTLGLGWSPSSDTLNFPINVSIENNSNNKITKRYIMSNAFKIFDPLGLLSPCIIKPKMLLQRLWQQKIDWDDAVPQDSMEEWIKFTTNLPYIRNLNIDRQVICDSAKYIEMHSFSDASQGALGACIYLKSINEDNKVTVKLLCAKSKVAPLKPTTMPRLELCAALLAARLCKAVTDSLRYRPDRIVHWCDSSIVLAWINNNKTLKAFVSNRISEILELTKSADWRYVPTGTNPADLISRGVDASSLPSLDLWWSGPGFLVEDESSWPMLKLNTAEIPEIKAYTTSTTESLIKFENYSKLTKLERTFALVKRFIHNLKNSNNKKIGILTCDELADSFKCLCLLAQSQSFPDEYNILLQNKSLSPKSKILPLSPFLDSYKLIRVGGRIDASSYPFEKKHPILLHSSHHLTKLIFDREHVRNMHAGPQLLLAVVRETVWPINGRHLARRTVNKCVCCRRHRGKTLYPKMGNLPPQRIVPDFPFVSVGLDFAGPFYILNRKGRGSKLIKSYLCLFVCMRYKCVHLEGVSDLSKNAFIMTLRRFVSRRGKPAEIHCDNGRNFVAAAKELGDFLKNNAEPLSDFASQEGIKFTFTPTYAPHFGGIWEAGVKSAKHHLRRVIGNSHLTFEEITTLFTQVEAILNSRPLYPMSSSPDDLLSLTPGHFLIGRPLTAMPTPSLESSNESSLQRYARVEKIRQHFWQRWQKEYIAELQQRTKWRTNTARLNIGDLVLLQEDHVPPLCWRLGRVARLFPGPDGISRVADISTTRGNVRRPLVRLCPLPTTEDVIC